MSTEKFVTVRFAAEVLDVTEETVRRWCDRFGFGVKATPRAHWRIPIGRIAQLQRTGVVVEPVVAPDGTPPEGAGSVVRRPTDGS